MKATRRKIIDREKRLVSKSPPLVVDLFCGIGGFSHGARKAGAQVVLAIDNWSDALRVHKLNHPKAVHLKMTLGGSVKKTADLVRSYLPASKKTVWHLHASPPCQRLSKANKNTTNVGKGKERDVNQGMRLVFWFLRLVRELKPTSWSMEQVPIAAKHLGLKEPKSHLYDAADFGVPQIRKRLIIGKGWVLKPTNNKIKRKSVLEALPHLKFEPVTHLHEYSTNRAVFKNGQYHAYRRLRGAEGLRPLNQPSYTLCSGIGPLALWNFNQRTGVKKAVRRLTWRESLVLQSFPKSYKFPAGMSNSTKNKLIGNALPPPFAFRIMKSVIANRGK